MIDKPARSYFEWLERQTRRTRTGRKPESEHQVAPSEPLEVLEHQADTTIVRRIRLALRNRLRGDQGGDL